jgi:aerobic C4-dicarboxylate transport protein
MSECRALTNLVGNACATIVVARWDKLDIKQKICSEANLPNCPQLQIFYKIILLFVARWDKALDKDLLDKALKNPKAE